MYNSRELIVMLHLALDEGLRSVGDYMYSYCIIHNCYPGVSSEELRIIDAVELMFAYSDDLDGLKNLQQALVSTNSLILNLSVRTLCPSASTTSLSSADIPLGPTDERSRPGSETMDITVCARVAVL